MSAAFSPRLEINGARAAADDLRLLVANNYGHFTAMRIEGGAVRGLGLHLDRLQQATRELFGSTLDGEQVRAWLRRAIGSERRELSVRINVFSRRFDRAHPAAAVPPDVLISVALAPATMNAAPLRLKSFRYARELPHVKHVGTFPLFHYRALAQDAGYDDALFVGADGCISEASIWNIGFVAGDGTALRIVWPKAPQLDGTGMRLLQAGMTRLGVASVSNPVKLVDLHAFRAAFLTNASSSHLPIAGIDSIGFEQTPELAALLARCHESNPLEAI
jgi:branched-subunit amino acid aminotransferase/4-amino-4-deoxychorismate lyase